MPETRASLVLDNTNLAFPNVIRPNAPISDDKHGAFFYLWRRLWSLRRLRLKPRQIPIRVWLIQVVLFLLTSLLNNAAFGYAIPMAVHIIFRSAGLVTNLLFGWLIGKRYTRLQVLSVILVTLGVASSTFAAKPRSTASTASSSIFDHASSYGVGIVILSVALALSSVMGLAQDHAYSKYGRGHWEEGLFYLHFLALPMFAFTAPELASQVHSINTGQKVQINFNQLLSGASNWSTVGSHPPVSPLTALALPVMEVPSFYFPLLLNILTTVVCISGVHRLTSRVSSLTVTLVLVVRKAVSLWISVIIFGKGRGDFWLWSGAAMVLLGTVAYTIGGNLRAEALKKKE